MSLDNNKDRLEAYEKMFEYIEKNSEEVGPKYDFWKKGIKFICPVCKRVHEEGFEKEGWSERYPYYIKGKYNAIADIKRGFSGHLMATIRLSGEIEHINLLVKIYGKNLGIKMLKDMVRKNRLIALNLDKIIKKFANSKESEK